MYGKHNALWCSQLLCHVYVLWQALNCGSRQTMGRDPQRGGKDFERAPFSSPEVAALPWHPRFASAFKTRVFDWQSCTTEPKVGDVTLGYVNTARVPGNIKAIQGLPTIWCKEKQTSGALLNYCQLFKNKTKFNENKNLYFTQALMVMTGAASKVNTSLL